MKRIAINEWAKPAELLSKLRQHNLETVEELDLNRNLLGPEGMRELAKMRFPRLVALELFANRIGDRGAQYLANAKFVQNLKRLGLGGEYRFGMDNEIGDEGFLPLLPALESVQDLQLGFNRAGSVAVAALGECRALKRLGIASNRLGSDGARTLAETKLRLEFVDVSDNGVTADGVEGLARGDFLQSVRHLDLTRNRFGDDGAIRLAAASEFRPQWLDLNECAIGDAGAMALAASPILSDVDTLGLGENHIDEAGLAALVASPHLGKLRTLCFRNNLAGPRYTPWLDWDGSEQGNDFDSDHARRIAAMFGRTIHVT